MHHDSRLSSVNPSEESTVLFTDEHDIEAASKAGTPSIAVRWGYLPSADEIEQWGACFIAGSPAELQTHLLQN